MSENPEHYVRWEPIAGRTEHPLGGFELSWTVAGLVATADYVDDPPVQGLRIDFGRVEAFKVYEEFSDPWAEDCPTQPRLANPTRHQYTWPLLEVGNSRWVQRVVARNGAIESYPWRHLQVVTTDMTLHVMTSRPEHLELIA